jgi:4a-hydroxytetrahydrobiopterin dehydratase
MDNLRSIRPTRAFLGRIVGVDTWCLGGNTGGTTYNVQATVRPQAGNDARGRWPVRARWRGDSSGDYLNDALALLAGWTREGREIKRTLRIDDTQHAALTERVKVAADALQLQPTIRRLNGYTQIQLCTPDGGKLTAGEVALAARIEDAYRAIVAL